MQKTDELDQEWTVEAGDHDLAAELRVGDHFTIRADEDDPCAEGAKFFILQCTTPMYVVEDDMLEDLWRGVVEKGDEVVEGVYYHQQGLADNSYLLMDQVGPTRIYSHLVFFHKFTMKLAQHRQKGGRAVYKLSKTDQTKIGEKLSILKEHEDKDSESDREPDESDDSGSE